MTEITIDLEKLGGEQPFTEQVVDAAARQLLRTWTAPGPDGEQSEIPTKLARHLEEEIVGVIKEQASAVTPSIAEQILEEGVAITNSYGSPREKRPLRDVIASRVETELYDGQTGRRGKGVLAEMIEREVVKVVRAELKEALDEATRKVVEAVSDEAGLALAQALEKALPKVRV